MYLCSTYVCDFVMNYKKIMHDKVIVNVRIMDSQQIRTNNKVKYDKLFCRIDNNKYK